MKLCLIKASAKSDFKDYKKARGGPPQSIFSAAAATPRYVEIEMHDEVIRPCKVSRIKADFAVIFFSTPDANRGYEIAETLRKKGILVALAGLHATMLPDEAAEYADSVITGELENIWHIVLMDAQTGKLAPRYSGTPADMSQLNPYPTDILTPKDYGWEWSVLVSRGCAHKCSFCLVPEFFGKNRYRPIDHVIAELEAMPADWVELHSDHLTEDREYALELFRRMEPLNIGWVGETTIRIADDQELLDAAARSGCKYLLIGIESISKAALKRAGKGFVKPEKLKEQIARIHAKGIAVDSAAVLGLDEHTPEIFKETADFYHDIGVDVSAPAITIPFPGTRFYKQLEDEGRLLSEDWADYDGSHAVFQPNFMTPEQLEKGADEFTRHFYSTGRIASRKLRQIREFGFDMAMRLGI